MFKINKLFQSFSSLALVSAAILQTVAFCSSAAGAALIENGSFENWVITSGNKGVPVDWSKNLGSSKADLIRTSNIAGSSEGSGYAAVISATSNLSTAVASNNGKIEIGFVAAATDPGGTSNRSFNVILTQVDSPSAGNDGLINIRASTSKTDASMLCLQAYDGVRWQLIADELLPSVYDADSNSFTTLNAYSFVLTLDLTAVEPSYSLSYGIVGGTMNTISDIRFFWNQPTEGGISYLMFNGNTSATPFAVGEVYAIPEGNAVAAFGIAVATTYLVTRRNKWLQVGRR